jgi:hypothetical protein
VLVSYRFAQPSGDTSSEIDPFVGRRQLSFSPFPADLRISPVSQDFRMPYSIVPWDHAMVETLEPLGHIRLDFNIDLGRATMYRSNNNGKIRP